VQRTNDRCVAPLPFLQIPQDIRQAPGGDIVIDEGTIVVGGGEMGRDKIAIHQRALPLADPFEIVGVGPVGDVVDDAVDDGVGDCFAANDAARNGSSLEGLKH
jgi:hypothetical protein